MPTRRRIALIAFRHATNTFSRVPTDLDAFSADGILRGLEMLDPAKASSVIAAAAAAADADDGVDAVPILAAAAISGGRVTAKAFESIVGEIGLALSHAKPDAVVLDLHGAMMTDEVDDGDAEVLRRVRQTVGPQTRLVAVLDARANVSAEIAALADALVVRDPLSERGRAGGDAMRLAIRAARGEVRPVCAFVRSPMLCTAPTTEESVDALRSLSAMALEIGHRPCVLSAGITLGFPYADSAATGAGAVVTTDDDHGLAGRSAGELAALLWARREHLRGRPVPVEEAVHAAMDFGGSGPTVLADLGDDPGSGGAGDGTALLWAFLDLGADNAALGVVVDPEVVALAFSAGVGARIECELGGKTGYGNGFPIPVGAVVRSLTDGAFTYEGPCEKGRFGSLGRAATLACDGRYGHVVEVVVCERRVEASDPAIFRSQGIEPTAKRIIVVKSAARFREAFAPIAGSIVGVDTPGPTVGDAARLGHTRLTRPIWPLDLF